MSEKKEILYKELELKNNINVEGIRFEPEIFSEALKADKNKAASHNCMDFSLDDTAKVSIPMGLRLEHGLGTMLNKNSESPYYVEAEDGAFFVAYKGERLSRFTLTEGAEFLNEKTSDGVLMRTIAQAGPAINEAFAADSIDIADYGNLPVTLAKAKGIGISEIGISNSKVDYAFLVKEDSDIKTLKDLEGKKVIVGVGTIIEQYWDRVVKEAGIDVSKVEIINDVATASTTFASGNADVWITNVSYIDVLKKQNVNVRVIESTTDNHPEWAGETVFTVRDKFKEEHPEVVTAFLTAYYKAYQYALAHEEETYQYLSSTMLTEENAKKIYGAVTPLFSNFSGKITEEEKKKQEELVEFLLEKGYIDQKLEVTELVDTSFYEEAVKKAAENQ